MAKREQLERAIAHIEAQRAVLGDAAVDAAIAGLRQELVALDQTQASPSDLRGERRQATALLADVEGSTELAERVDAETWVEIMNRVFHLLGDAIYRYGGEIGQYRGDGLVAFFGVKGAHEDDPERAVRAGLAMQKSIHAYAAELEADRGIELLLRVGINSGEVIAMQVGDRRQHSEDTAMGRAIALAARMESAAQPGTVLVTADTYRLTRRLFEWQALGEIMVKGVSQPVTVYRPLGASAAAGKARGIEGLSSPLVGRDGELAALRGAVDSLQRGVGGIVTLVGEAGLGKSRLVAEVRALTLGGEQPANVRWVEGRCLSYGGSIAYLPWLDMLRSVLDVTADAQPLAVRDTLRARVQALCPDCCDAVYPYLCRLMSLPLEDEYAALRSLQGESLRAEVFLAVQTLVEGTARQQPLVMVCEDLHWADATSLALLERVLALTDQVALLLVFVFRPETEHGCWQLKEAAVRLYRHRHTDLWLDALTADESQALVGNLLSLSAARDAPRRVEDLPPALRAAVLDQAEGNPLYVEEIIRALIDDGAIACDDTSGRWRATREIAAIPIPDTLHGVLAARIDRLQEETRRVLRLASVIGRVFLYRVLAEIAREEGHLDTRLVTLQRQQLIRERARMPELEYIFKHELTREAAYSGLLLRERLVHHRQVAETLERLYPAQADERAGLLAHHWERAEEPQKAIEYLLQAGEQARLAYANQEAIDYYQRALALLDAVSPEASGDPRHLTALIGLGKARYHAGMLSEAEGPLRTAIGLGEAARLDPRALMRMYWWLGEVLWWQGRYDEDIALAHDGLALLETDDDSTEAVLMNQRLAISHLYKGERGKAREYVTRAARVVRDLPYAEELVPVYNACVGIYMEDGNLAESQRWLQLYETRARQHHDLRALSEVHYRAGAIHGAQGRCREAVSEGKQLLELAARIGDPRLVCSALALLVQAHMALGALSDAETHARRWVEAGERLGSLSHRVWARGALGMSLLYQGVVDEAIPLLSEASTLESQELGSAYRALWSLCLATVYLAQERRQDALTQAQKATAVAETWEPDPLLLVALALVERACQTPQDYRTFCRRYREEHPDAANPRYAHFVQWQLEPAEEETARRLAVVRDRPSLADAFTLPGWRWIDPYDDCSHTIEDGLVIHAANGRDLWHLNRSAPRFVRQASGAFVVQTVCLAAMDDRPAIGGLLLWKDEGHYLRLDLGYTGEDEVTFVGCVGNQDVVIGRGRLHSASSRFTLCLARAGDRLEALCSADGKGWYTVGSVAFPVEDPVQVGVHAIGNVGFWTLRAAHPEGTAIRFESFEMCE